MLAILTELLNLMEQEQEVTESMEKMRSSSPKLTTCKKEFSEVLIEMLEIKMLDLTRL